MPCSLNFALTSTCTLLHDKARDMRNVVIHQQLETSPCNFHGLAAYSEHLLGPLLTRFKAVMRAWCPLVLDYLITGYLSFISAINPTINCARRHQA